MAGGINVGNHRVEEGVPVAMALVAVKDSAIFYAPQLLHYFCMAPFSDPYLGYS